MKESQKNLTNKGKSPSCGGGRENAGRKHLPRKDILEMDDRFREFTFSTRNSEEVLKIVRQKISKSVT